MRLINSLRRQSLETAVGCLMACGFLQLTGALLAAVNAGVIA